MDPARSGGVRAQPLLPWALAGCAVPLLFTGIPAPIVLGALGVLAVLGALWSRSRFAASLIAGILWTCLHMQHALDARLHPDDMGRDVWLQGRVVGLVDHSPQGLRFEFVPEPGSGLRIEPRRIRLSAFAPFPDIRSGERWRFEVRLKRPHGVQNPGGFDFERHALERGIDAVGYLRRPQQAMRIEPAASWRLDAIRERLAGQVLAASDLSAIALVATLALGDTRALDQAQWETLRATGTGHLMAISGLHVGLAAAIGMLPGLVLCRIRPRLMLLAPRRVWCVLPGLFAAVCYAALAGFAIPTQRALIMLAVAALVLLLRRNVSAWRGLQLAATCVLLLDPLAVLSPGFWLSFCAVAALGYVLGGRRGGRGGRVAGLLRAQWAVGLGLLPLGLVFFGQTSVVGFIANLVAIPVVSMLIVPLTLAGLLAYPLAAHISAALWAAAAWLMEGLVLLLDALAGLPLARWAGPETGLIAAALAVVGVLLILAPRGVPQRWLGVVMLLPALWPWTAAPGAGQLRVDLLDVGQGLAVLLRTENHAVLYDAGPRFMSGFDAGEAWVLPSLAALGVTRLDMLVISHDDSDHAGGAQAVLRRYPEAQVLGGTDTIAGSTCMRGIGWAWDGVAFEVLHPLAGSEASDNERSCVLRVSTGRHAILLPGDTGTDSEIRMRLRNAAELDADVLIAGHHGSRGSSSRAFLADVSPSLVLYSAGWHNRFGQPHPRVVERVAQTGALELNTAVHGAVTLVLDPQTGLQGLNWRRQSHRRPWAAVDVPAGEVR